MENKYYTPDISEFHIGFEYEWTSCKTIDWHKAKLEFIGGDSFRNFYLSTEIRAKLLDREDIESLGWIFNNDDCHFDYLKYRLSFCDGVIDIRVVGDSYREEYCFNGRIKNKSELQKLLIQLGIK